MTDAFLCRKMHAHRSAKAKANCDAGITPVIKVAGILDVGSNKPVRDRLDNMEQYAEELRRRIERLERLANRH